MPLHYNQVNLYFQDESRFGLHTKYGRGLTAKGVQPVCCFQQVFENSYLFGAFSPINGDRFLIEFPCCNADTFQQYLNQFSQHHKEEYKIIVLDNGAFHKAKALKVPENMALLFLPPYSPELNPAEKIWHSLKRKFTNRFFASLEEVSSFFTEALQELSVDRVISTCAFSYIFSNLIWSN